MATHPIARAAFLSFFTLLPLAARAATPEEESRFEAAFRKAFADRDVAALAPLICRDRTPDAVRESSDKMYGDLVKETSVTWDIVLRDPDLKFVGKDSVEAGVTYRPNLKVTKQLDLRARDKDKKIVFVLTCAVGEQDGKLLLASWNPVK